MNRMVRMMKTYSLPQSLELNGALYAIRSDWRAIYDICEALQDDLLSIQEKSYSLLAILFKQHDNISNDVLEIAVKRGMWFISGGNLNNSTNSSKLVDWEQDFPLIIAAVNRVAGCELRSVPYLHWWTFLSYFQEIGDCLFSRVVSIRAKKAKHEPLDKAEKEFIKANRNLIFFSKDKDMAATEPSPLLQSILGIGDVKRDAKFK